jgi:D-glycero-alpha-D-manno-heptose 1-phosphate guanylyltransferase
MAKIDQLSLDQNCKGEAQLPATETTAVLLVGGMGTRLRSVVSGLPKPLAAVGRGSFLELLVLQLRQQGIRRLLMCTGYLSHQIEDKFESGCRWGISVEYSKEDRPMGTGGAIKLAQCHLRHQAEFIVMNGDSFLDADFHRLIRFHREKKALVTIAVLTRDNCARYGRVHMNSDSQVIGFSEKADSATPGLVSAGIYVFNNRIFEHISEGPSSLETDVFPNLLEDRVYAQEQHGMFIDIGTPDDYARAQRLSSRLYGRALTER